MSIALDLINDALTEKQSGGDIEGIHVLKITHFEENDKGNIDMVYTSDVIEKIKPEGFSMIFWAPKDDKETKKLSRKLIGLYVATNGITDSEKILKNIFTGDDVDYKKLAKHLLNKEFKGLLYKREASDGNRYARLFDNMFVGKNAEDTKLQERFDDYAKYMFESQNVLIGKYYKPSNEPTGFGAPATAEDDLAIEDDDLGF